MTEETTENDTVAENPQGTTELPPPDFTSFIISLSTSVLIDLGEIDNPISKEKAQNIDMAQHTIDLMDMLATKTEGNLSEEEETFFKHMLSDLRIRYIKAAESK